MQEFISVKDAAEKWEVSPRTVQALCAAAKIEGAIKISNIWVIPAISEYPSDGRVKNGKYFNWRKKCKE